MAAVLCGTHIGAKRFSRCMPAHPCLAAQSHEWQSALQSSFQDLLRTTYAGDEGSNLRHNTPSDSRRSCHQSLRFFALGLHQVGYILRSLQTQAMHAGANSQARCRMVQCAQKNRYTYLQKKSMRRFTAKHSPCFLMRNTSDAVPVPAHKKSHPEVAFLSRSDQCLPRYLRKAAIWAANTASSDWALAMSTSFLAFFMASSAAALAC